MPSISKYLVTLLFALTITSGKAQIGEHRSLMSLGVNGGYIMSNVGFTPKVPQTMKGGATFGLTARYTCEKYFSTICSIYGELNIANIGWKEDIRDINDKKVINPATGTAEEYSRQMTYLQLPVFAHLAWGHEEKGLQFFVQAGPQFGIFLNEKTKSNFSFNQINLEERSNTIVAQDTMAVENKFDYGIAGGVGIEYSHKKIGHLLLEARYYYGLGNIYGNSKRDYFGKSNFGNIVLKMTYLIDL